MPQPDGCFNFVNILSAFPARTVGIPGDICRVHLDFEVIVNKRRHKNRGEGGLAFSLGIERGYAHKPVDTVFAFQVSVCSFAVYFKGDRLTPTSSPAEIEFFYL